MNNQLGKLIFSFFEDHLKCQNGLQPTSIKSYRDALCLFLGLSLMIPTIRYPN